MIKIGLLEHPPKLIVSGGEIKLFKRFQSRFRFPLKVRTSHRDLMVSMEIIDVRHAICQSAS